MTYLAGIGPAVKEEGELVLDEDIEDEFGSPGQQEYDDHCNEHLNYLKETSEEKHKLVQRDDAFKISHTTILPRTMVIRIEA
jgi:hypothetical protein